MSKSRLVCTVELDLPDNLSEAHKLQGPLLEMWAQFAAALPEQGITNARVDSRVVKTKEQKAKVETLAQVPQTARMESGSEIPPFMKR